MPNGYDKQTIAIRKLILPVASSDSVVESRLSFAFLGCFLVFVLSLFSRDIVALRTDLCIWLIGNEGAEGFGRGRGNRPLRALTAAAVAG